jgi:hypothetical protein
MTKQVKPAKILWRYCLSLPYHDYRPHMSCNEIDECNAGLGSGVSSCHVTLQTNPIDKKQQPAAYRGAGFTRGGSILQLKVKGRLAVRQICATWHIRK